jgi:hypothetical protein
MKQITVVEVFMGDSRDRGAQLVSRVVRNEKKAA